MTTSSLRSRRSMLAAVLTAAALALAGCGGERPADSGGGGTKRLSIATGNTTGVYYVLGGGLAEQITKNLPGYQATAEATGASVENLQRIARGDSDIAFTLADSAADAVNGTGSFTAKQPITALARLYNNYTQVIALKGSGVESVADLRGKRVSTGSPNSGTEVIAVRLLQAAGLDPDTDIKRQALGLPETVQAMKDGTIDALFWSGGLPTAGITDLTTSLKGKVTFLPLTDLLPKLQQQFGPIYVGADIPAATYGQSSPTPSIAVPNLLVVKADMDAQLAHDLTKLLFDRKAELEKVHPSAKDIDLATAADTGNVPLHEGAKRFYSSS